MRYTIEDFLAEVQSMQMAAFDKNDIAFNVSITQDRQGGFYVFVRRHDDDDGALFNFYGHELHEVNERELMRLKMYVKDYVR